MGYKLYDLILDQPVLRRRLCTGPGQGWVKLQGPGGGEKFNQRLNCKHVVPADHCQ